MRSGIRAALASAVVLLAAQVKALDWQLRGDARAAGNFTGKDCGLCRDKAWKIEKKRVD